MAEYLGLDSVGALQMTKLFDRRNKITDQEFEVQARAILGEAQAGDIAKIKQIIDAKDIESLPEELQRVSALDEIRAVFDGLRGAGVDGAIFDATLMRGLDYYTGTVFEVFDTHPDNNRSLFGGGRYDGLVGLFGAEPISAVGAAPGSTMLENFLDVHGLLPENKSKTDIYIVVIGDVLNDARRVAYQLRQAGINVEVDITDRKLDKQIKTAVKKNIPYLLFVGEKDIATGEFSLKNVEEGTEDTLSPEQIIEKFQA
jgi:histidyl-tRNA synthetase